MKAMKGFLFGSVLMLLSLGALALSVVVSDSQRDFDAAKLSVFDRVDDELKAANNGYKGILGKFVKIRAIGNNVTFSETLPDTSASDFFVFVGDFTAFVEANATFKIDVNLSSINDTLPLVIRPASAVYHHPDGFGDNILEVISASQVTGYNVTVLLNKTGSTPVEWEQGPVNDPQGMAVYIQTGGLTGHDFVYSGTLSRTQLSKLKLKVPGQDMFIEIGNDTVPGRARVISDNQTTTALVNTTVTVGMNSPFVTFPGSSINITAGEYNISRIAAVRVA